MKRHLLFLVVLFVGACVTKTSNMNKIKFDYSILDNNGLIGPSEGKISLAYEFCIPGTEKARRRILEIDNQMEISTSPGRIKCSEHEYLCIGHTNQNYLEIFKAITQLEFVKRVERCYFE